MNKNTMIISVAGSETQLKEKGMTSHKKMLSFGHWPKNKVGDKKVKGELIYYLIGSSCRFTFLKSPER